MHTNLFIHVFSSRFMFCMNLIHSTALEVLAELSDRFSSVDWSSWCRSPAWLFPSDYHSRQRPPCATSHTVLQRHFRLNTRTVNQHRPSLFRSIAGIKGLPRHSYSAITTAVRLALLHRDPDQTQQGSFVNVQMHDFSQSLDSALD